MLHLVKWKWQTNYKEQPHSKRTDLKLNATDDIEGIDDVTETLAHLTTVLVAYHSMQVNLASTYQTQCDRYNRQLILTRIFPSKNRHIFGNCKPLFCTY